MDKLIALITNLNLENILRGINVDVSALSDQQVSTCANLLAHCILNGPVGINTDTNFPTGEKGSIKGLMGIQKLSNSSWRNLASIVAQKLLEDLKLKDVIIASQQFAQYKTLWPLWDKKIRTV